MAREIMMGVSKLDVPLFHLKKMQKKSENALLEQALSLS